MHARIAVPLLILVSACAQVPTSAVNTSAVVRPGILEDSTPAVQTPAAEVVAAPAVTPVAPPAPAAAPARAQPAAPQPQMTVHLQQPPLKEPSDAPANNLWTRIGKGYVMPPMDNELVREWENWYSTRPDYVGRMIHRSSHFLYHIVEQVEKRKMPAEIALLPMIESAYNPVAYSRSHAAGMWQFIASTGKDFGLRQNWWYDGRRDVLAATEAALDYLQKLHGMFNDWNLALAAYNWGEGAVGRAIERNRARGLPTDYESLTLPPETRAYVPKLIAVKNIISNPSRYGLSIAEIPNAPYFETITLKRHIDVKLAARMANMPLEEFRFLNPGHSKPVIKAGEAKRIVLPKDRIAVFTANIDQYDKPLVSWQTVTLRRGEKAEKVAASHGMTLAELKQVNGLSHQRRLATGQPLLVPLKNGVDNPHLPDLPATPVALPKAIQAAKARGTRQAQSTRGAKAVHASRKGLRPEAGKRVKVVVTAKTGKKPTGQRQKIASR